METRFPFVADIEKETLENEYYRHVLFTTPEMQLTVMTLQPGEDIPEEVHEGSQFIRVEAGVALVEVNHKSLVLSDNDTIIIPAHQKHYVKSIGIKPLKLYSIYSPPEHPPHRIDRYPPT